MIEVGVPADGAREVTVAGTTQLPDQIAVLPLRDTVTFPEMPVPLNVGQERSIELVNDALRGDRSIVMVAGRDPEVETPGPDELYSVGVAGFDRADDPPAGRVSAGADPGRPARADRQLGREPSRIWSRSSSPRPTSCARAPNCWR